MFPILCLVPVMLRSVRLAARLIKLTAQEYADTYGVDIRTAYNELKGAVHTLMKRTLFLANYRRQKNRYAHHNLGSGI